MIRDIFYVLEGGIKYLEIIVFGFINILKGKVKKNLLLRKLFFLDILLLLEKY